MPDLVKGVIPHSGCSPDTVTSSFMPSAIQQPGSHLVTAIGWITIVASGVSLVLSGYAVFRIGLIILNLPLVIAAIVVSIVGILCGRGLLKRRNWARIAMVFYLSLAIISTAASYVFFGTDSRTIHFGAGESSALAFEPSFSSLIGLLFYGLGIYVLLRPDVRKEFGE